MNYILIENTLLKLLVNKTQFTSVVADETRAGTTCRRHSLRKYVDASQRTVESSKCGFPEQAAAKGLEVFRQRPNDVEVRKLRKS